jgi:hypothetical protein
MHLEIKKTFLEIFLQGKLVDLLANNLEDFQPAKIQYGIDTCVLFVSDLIFFLCVFVFVFVFVFEESLYCRVE